MMTTHYTMSHLQFFPYLSATNEEDLEQLILTGETSERVLSLAYVY